MKNILRAFAFSLVATGAVASMHTSTNSSTILAPTVATRVSLPVPTCPPNDPNACGIANLGN